MSSFHILDLASTLWNMLPVSTMHIYIKCFHPNILHELNAVLGVCWYDSMNQIRLEVGSISHGDRAYNLVGLFQELQYPVAMQYIKTVYIIILYKDE